MWFRWVTDFGLPGPDRGEGGKYLLVGPGYDGPLPDSGFHVSHVRTTRAMRAGPRVHDRQRPRPGGRGDQGRLPHLPVPAGSGGHRGRRASWPGARRSPARPSAAETTFVDAMHLAMNTIPPNDFSLLGDDQRGRPAGAGRRRRSRDPGSARRGRDPQGPAVRARRADARDPRGRRGRRQRHRAHDVLRAARVGRLRLLPGLGVVQHAVGRRLRVHGPAAR